MENRTTAPPPRVLAGQRKFRGHRGGGGGGGGHGALINFSQSGILHSSSKSLGVQGVQGLDPMEPTADQGATEMFHPFGVRSLFPIDKLPCLLICAVGSSKKRQWEERNHCPLSTVFGNNAEKEIPH